MLLHYINGKQRFTLVILALCVSLHLFAKNRFGTDAIKPSRSITYKKVGDIELRLHVFEPAQKSDGPRAAIVFFFGGGWMGGTPLQFYQQCQYLAEQGMVAISAEYRTKRRGQVEPRECVKDGKAAIRYVRQHAKELNIDPDRIAAGGGSAGGHVAAATGTVKGFEHDGEDLSISSRPDALVLYNPVYDNGPDGYGHERVKDYWKEFSPLHNINKNTPPAIVFFGSLDQHVKMSSAKAFQKKMQEFGIRSELFIYEGKKHGFFNSSSKPGGNQWFTEVMTETHKFLADLGYLTSKPAAEDYVSRNLAN